MAETSDKGKVSAEEFKLRLQIETSLLVWMRTSLGLMGFGFVIARFGLFLREIARVGSVTVQSHPTLALLNSISGTVMILLGVVALLVSLRNHLRLMTQLERGELSLPPKWSFGVILCILLVALGMGMSIYIAVIEM